MLKILFLILSILVITACDTMPKFPVNQVRMLDVQRGVCGLYSVTVPKSGKPQYTYIKDIDIRECDGSVCLAPIDFKNAQNWILNVRDDYTCKLKK